MIEIPASLEPIASLIRSLMGTVQWVLGGIFGLYVILIVIKIFEYKKISKRLKQIEAKLEKLIKRRK